MQEDMQDETTSYDGGFAAPSHIEASVGSNDKQSDAWGTPPQPGYIHPPIRDVPESGIFALSWQSTVQMGIFTAEGARCNPPSIKLSQRESRIQRPKTQRCRAQSITWDRGQRPIGVIGKVRCFVLVVDRETLKGRWQRSRKQEQQQEPKSRAEARAEDAPVSMWHDVNLNP